MRYFPAPYIPLTELRGMDRARLAEWRIHLDAPGKTLPQEGGLLPAFQELRHAMMARRLAALDTFDAATVAALRLDCAAMPAELLALTHLPETRAAASRAVGDAAAAVRYFVAEDAARARGLI